MPGRPYVLREATWKTVRAATCDVAVLPWGATEAHNLHLPYGTDIYEAEAVAIEAARLAWEQGTLAMVLPALPFGVNTGQLDIPLTINMNPSTQLQVLRDVADSLLVHDIRKLVLVNGHGGNEFRALIRELQGSHKMLIIAVNWWQVEPAQNYLENAGDHAGALETAIMLHLAPELVLPLSEAGSGAVRSPRLRALREGWAWTPRRWTQVTDDTGVGDPASATVSVGERFFQAVTARIAQLLVELKEVSEDQLYE